VTLVRLSAIVVAYGKEELLGGCLESLEAALARVDGETELIVVVNDDETNLGFAGGVAAGLADAHGEWIALVNDDCTVEPDALTELLAAAAGRPDVGSVAAQVRFAGDEATINSAGLEIDELGVARERRLGEPVAEIDDEVVAVFGASAALALYRRAMLDAVGGLDTSFFAYLEDADLAWRARMAGWSCVLAPRAIGIHRHSATLGHGSKAKHLLVGRNRVRMLAKNASGRQLRRRLPAIVAYDLLYVAHAAVADRTLAPLDGRLRGIGDWRSYRRAGRARRREIELSPAPGVRAARRRTRVYRTTAGEAR
jgi:GT2 family glycosyltransferase